MATSSSYNFVVTRDQLITDALLHINAIGEGETPSANAVTEASRVLNMLVKLRASDGMPLWAIKRATILPVTGVSSVTSISHVVSFYDLTTVATAVTSGTTLVIATSGANFANSDQIGIELDDGTMMWTTISSGGGTVTLILAGTFTGTEGASVGNRVYAYTASADRIPRPLRVLGANIRETTDDTIWELDIEDHSDYHLLSEKYDASIPNVLYYDAGLGLDTGAPDSATNWYGTFNFAPQFYGGDHVIEFSYQRPFQDFDSSTDAPEFPQEFYLPLMLELAALLGGRHQVSPEERKALFAEAAMYRGDALESIAPEGSITITPEVAWE